MGGGEAIEARRLARAGSDYKKQKIGTKAKKKQDEENGDVLRTTRFVSLPCRLHGAAATKRGAARAIIEAEKRIVFYRGERECEKIMLLWTFVSNERKATCWRRVSWAGTGLKSGPGGLPGTQRR